MERHHHSTPSTSRRGASNSRTRSSPEQLGVTMMSPAEASRRLIASESMTYFSPLQHVAPNDDDLDEPSRATSLGTIPPTSPAPNLRNDCASSALSECISGLSTLQLPIISMEDDDISDQEVGQLEDHGPFQSFSRLWGHHAHLAVFINYVLSNSDPSSLLFYLVTDLYKEGSAKEMRKWAYEIHSSFLVPGAPLRLHNVDENVAHKVDDVLLKEFDKEEILRKIFWKARTRAKEELKEQLADFREKRTAGLGALFGPCDAQLDESGSDKARETRIIETYLLPKMEHYLEDMEKENVDLRQFTIAAGLATILTKIFQVRPATLERVPTFVAKDRSNIRARLLTGRSRKVTIRGHQFVAHQYLTFTYCNYCQLIIGGIGPQGYQCGDCSFNVHRQCVRAIEEDCPGPLVNKKEKANDRIGKFMEKIRSEIKPSSSHHLHFEGQAHHVERIRQGEEESAALIDGEDEEHRGSGATGNARSSNERGRISLCGTAEHVGNVEGPSTREDISGIVQQNISSKPKRSNVNRSQSYKERIRHKRQLREKRKTSDPNLSKTSDGRESTGSTFLGSLAGSLSNSNLSTSSLDSPNTSLEQAQPTTGPASASISWDSDLDGEPDPPDWSVGVADEVPAHLSITEKKRQEVINELFHTERSHVRALKVLSRVFHRPLVEVQLLPVDQMQLLFSNLDEMLTIHSRFNQAMKLKKRESPRVGDVGQLLLEMFDGEAGEAFERAATVYCAKQQIALDSLRERRKKDPKFNSFLNEIEANPLCRRLQLKDHILTGTLRLTKYPLLLEKLAKYTAGSNEKETIAVLRSLERSKEIVGKVNQAVREAENHQRLAEVQRIIDRLTLEKFDHPTIQEFKNLDITKRRIIHEGPLQWRKTEQSKLKPVDLHVILMDDTILLLHRQDEKYILKFMIIGNADKSPIIKLSTALVRHNEADKNSLYLVNTSRNGGHIYNLAAASSVERESWYHRISDAVEAYKARDRHGKRSSTSIAPHSGEPASTVEESMTKPDVIFENIEPDQEPEEETDDGDSAIIDREGATAADISASGPYVPQQALPGSQRQLLSRQTPEIKASETRVINKSLRKITRMQFLWADSVEGHNGVPPSVHVADAILAPLERLKRNNEIVSKTLKEKQSLVADILNIPKEDFENITDVTTEPSGIDKKLARSLFIATNETNRLAEIVNSALNVTEVEAFLASRGTSSTSVSAACKATGCPVSRGHSWHTQPLVPVASIQAICRSLASQFAQSLELIKIIGEERDGLRKELRRNREYLHAFDTDAQRRETSDEGVDDLDNEEFVDACGDSDIDIVG